MQIRAKKSLGQNFLKSKKALLAMIEAGEITSKDTVLEIGPGQGALTEKLLETGAKVIAVEKDDRLIESLNEKFSKETGVGQFTLIHDDILELDLNSIGLKSNDYKLIANIPYYITGLIFRKFLSGNIQPSKLVIMVQKEIADRIIARNGKESLLSLSVKAYGRALKIMKVEKKNFSPKPKVDSAILLINNISKDFFSPSERSTEGGKEISEEKFFEVIKTGFAHKRKMLMTNLKEKFGPPAMPAHAGQAGQNNLLKIFQDLKIPEKARSEDLKLEDWKGLIKHIRKSHE